MTDLLEFFVDGQNLKRSDRDRLVAGSVGFVEFCVHFDPRWASYTKTLLVRNTLQEDTYCVFDIKDGKPHKLPHEVLVPGGEVEVSVFGAGENAACATANSVRIFVEPNLSSGDIKESLAPSPTLFEQICEQLRETLKSLPGKNLMLKGEDDGIYWKSREETAWSFLTPWESIQGKEGTRWFFASDFPEEAKEGDFFFSKDTGDIYQKDGEWFLCARPLAAAAEARQVAEGAAKTVQALVKAIQGAGTRALSQNSLAVGANTTAGTKAFKIVSEPTGTVGGEGVYILDSVEGIEVGMEYSSVTLIAAYRNGKITAVDAKNRAVTVDNFPGHPLNAATDDPKNYNLYNLFIIVDRPELGTLDAGFNARTEGNGTYASQAEAHAEGRNTRALGKYAHTEGEGTVAGHASHAEGSKTNALGVAAHAEGNKTVALNSNSHAEGRQTNALGLASHAEGEATQAKGSYSHAQGWNTVAEGYVSHAEGLGSQAKGSYSHAEGWNTVAKWYACHAQGRDTQALGSHSHAEGWGTVAEGYVSHAQGRDTRTWGDYSHAEGEGTVAAGNHQHVQGRFNTEDTAGKYAHIVGNGASDAQRSNAHTVDWDGNAWFAGDVLLGADRVSILNLIKELKDRLTALEGGGSI